MVFKTFDSDIQGLSNKTGVLNSSFKTLFANVNNNLEGVEGKFNRFKSVTSTLFSTVFKKPIITNDDISTLENYMNPLLKVDDIEKVKQNILKDAANTTIEYADNIGYLYKQYKAGEITQEQYLSKSKEIIKSTQSLISVQKKASISSRLLSTGLNLLTNIGISLAFNFIISKITKFVNKSKELKQAHEEEIQKANDLVQTLSEENNKLDQTIKKYSELHEKTELTSEEKETLSQLQEEIIDSYGREAEGLDLVNGKYEDNLGILKNINDENLKRIELNQRKLTAEAKSNLNNYGDDFDSGKNFITFDSKTFTDSVKANLKTQLENTQGLIGDLFKNNDIQIGKDYISVNAPDIEGYKLAYETILDYLDNIQGRTAELGGDFDISLNKGTQQLINELQVVDNLLEDYDTQLKKSAETKLSQYVNLNGDIPKTKQEFEIWVNNFQKFANPSKNADFKNILNETLNNISSNYEVNNGGKTILKSLSEIISNAKDEIKSYSEEVDKIIESESVVQSALSEFSDSNTLSYETVKKLRDIGLDSAIGFNAATKSYTLNKEALDKLIGSQKDSITENLNQSKSIFLLTSQQSSEYQELEDWRKKTGRTTNDIVYQHKLEELGIKSVTKSFDLNINSLQKTIDLTSEYSQYLDLLSNKLNTNKESINNFSNSQSTIQSAIKEQEEFGRISASTILALGEAGYTNAMAYNAQTGETILLTDKINDLTQAQVNNKKVELQNSINETTEKLKELNKEYDLLLNTEMNSNKLQKITDVYNYIQKYKDKLGIQELQLMALGSFNFSFESDTEDIEKTAEEYFNSIKEAFNKEKSELDHLLSMDVISQEDYYNRLFNLNEKYFKNKAELLDEYRQYEEEVYKGLKEVQIKAIQEQIDALKSVNEEKQEEIDLEKAKRALDNAKRQKNITVYDSERGWIHETDRNAIDSAQKEYDDLVLNEKVEALENLIDLIENGTNASHKLDESVNAIEQARILPGMTDLMQLAKGSSSDTLNSVLNSIKSDIGMPTDMIHQFDNNSSNNNYKSDYKTMNVNIDKVVTDNPMQFVKQMENIADKSFDNKFPNAMNKFADDLNRYRMNHSN